MVYMTGVGSSMGVVCSGRIHMGKKRGDIALYVRVIYTCSEV